MQVGAIIVYTYVFKMLAPPPGQTFDSCDEERDKLPIKAPNTMSSVAKYPSSAHGNTHEEEPLLSIEEEEEEEGQDVHSLGSKVRSGHNIMLVQHIGKKNRGTSVVVTKITNNTPFMA